MQHRMILIRDRGMIVGIITRRCAQHVWKLLGQPLIFIWPCNHVRLKDHSSMYFPHGRASTLDNTVSWCLPAWALFTNGKLCSYYGCQTMLEPHVCMDASNGWPNFKQTRTIACIFSCLVENSISHAWQLWFVSLNNTNTMGYTVPSKSISQPPTSALELGNSSPAHESTNEVVDCAICAATRSDDAEIHQCSSWKMLQKHCKEWSYLVCMMLSDGNFKKIAYLKVFAMLMGSRGDFKEKTVNITGNHNICDMWQTR